jgi:uncharacterized membrane protein
MSFAFLCGAGFAAVGLTELFGISLAFQHECSLAFLTAFCVLHSVSEFGLGRAAWLLSATVVVVVVAEGPYVADWLFGRYVFTEACKLGPRVLPGNRPLFVPIAWYVTAYPAMGVARVLSWRSGGRHRLAYSVALTVASNFVADPVMSSTGSGGWVGHPAPEWRWLEASAVASFQGVPLSNALGWAVTSAVFLLLFAVTGSDDGWPRDAASPLLVSLCLALFYILHPAHALAVRFAALVLLVAPACLGLVIVISRKT